MLIKIIKFMFVMAVLLMASDVFANIPEVKDILEDGDGKTGFELIHIVIHAVATIIIVALVLDTFIASVRGGIEKFKDMKDGRATWADVGGQFLGGAAIVVLVLFVNGLISAVMGTL